MNMADTIEEHYFFGFGKFFGNVISNMTSLNPQSITKKNDGEENAAYLSPMRTRFAQHSAETCVTWSAIFQLFKGNGKVNVCGWEKGRIILPEDKIFLPLDETIVSLSGSWNKLLLISEKGRCHVAWNLHGDWTVHCVSSLENDEGEANEKTFLICGVGDMHQIVVDKGGKPYQVKEEKIASNLPKFIYSAIPFDARVDEVSCGKEHVLMLNKEHGTVYSFGLGSRGQLGHGQVNPEKTPKRIEALAGIRIKQVASGGWHSLALSEFGDIYSWGWNECGQLGISCVPPEVPLSFYMLPYIVEFPEECSVGCVGCGARHSVAVTSQPEGSVWTWGWGCYGQLGHGDGENKKTPTLVKYFENIDSRVSKITCGPWQTIVSARKKC